jgi:nicotinate-nucleotide adenylyltransferase
MHAKQRIALYGGTFDPVHLGHLDVARKVCELFEIEKVLFIPAQVAPHKLGRAVSAPIHRYAMLALATQSEPSLAISPFEIEAPDRRYTVNTLEHFVGTLGETNDLFFVMGADSWTEITTWRDWKNLLTMVNHIVVTRPGYDVQGPPEMKDRIVDLRSRTNWNSVVDGAEPKIFLTDAVMKDVSATQIRLLASEGRFDELTQFVSAPVAQYIQKYALYRESHEA